MKMFHLELNENLAVPGLPDEMRVRIYKLLAQVKLANAERWHHLPRWLWAHERIIRGDFGLCGYVQEEYHRKQLMDAKTDDEQRKLVSAQIVRRCRFVGAVLHLMNSEQQKKSIYDALAAELKELRTLIRSAAMPSDPLVVFAERLALAVHYLSGWRETQSFNQLITKVESLSVSCALKAVHVLYDKVKKVDAADFPNSYVYEFPTDHLYQFPPVPMHGANDELLELANALEDALDACERYSASIQSFVRRDNDFFVAELEAAVEGRTTEYTRVRWGDAVPSIEQFKSWIQEGDANSHDSIEQLKLWHAQLLRSRDRLAAALQAATACIIEPSVEDWHMRNAFGSCSTGSAYHAMVNCIVAKLTLAKIGRELKDYAGREAAFPKVKPDPIAFIDSILAKNSGANLSTAGSGFINPVSR